MAEISGVRRLSGKVCVVNGAASEIGTAVAQRLSDEGAFVVGTDRLEHSTGDTSLAVDLLDESQVVAMYEDVVRTNGHIDVIYNNVGEMDFDDRAVMDTDLDTWHRVVDGNLTVVFLSCKHGIPHVRDTSLGGGSDPHAASRQVHAEVPSQLDDASLGRGRTPSVRLPPPSRPGTTSQRRPLWANRHRDATSGPRLQSRRAGEADGALADGTLRITR